jgi:hypothetical protein
MNKSNHRRFTPATIRFFVQPGCRVIAGMIIAIVFALIQSAPGATVVWDASGANPTAPTDGSGNWSTANANWSDGVADNVWVNGNNAIFGSGGAGGAIAVGSGIVVGNITLNTGYLQLEPHHPRQQSHHHRQRCATTRASIGNLLTGTAFTWRVER